MKRYFKDFYGCTASIGPTRDKRQRLRICNPNGHQMAAKVFDTYKGARQALAHWSEGWTEVPAKSAQ